MFDLENAFDNNRTWLAIFFDFAKAFDLVPHDLLLQKLSASLPPWLVRWIACYLSNRSQCVKIGELSTEWKKVEAGVIQGSVLGPVLFLIFVADINNYIPAGVNIEKYADDIIAYIIGAHASSELPQLVAEAIEKWCTDNRMRLNVDKCKVMHSKPSPKFKPPEIKLNNIALASVNEYKYLGFHLNPKFDARLQWSYVQPLISQNIHLLKQLRSCGLREPILVAVFKSLVNSHLRYSSTLLVSCPDGTLADIQVLQNSLLRSIGISRDTARTKYNIKDSKDFITESSLDQVVRILSNSNHALTVNLASKRNTHSSFPFTIPIPVKNSFKRNAVMLALVHLRDNVYGTGRSNPRKQPQIQCSTPATTAIEPRGKPCTNPACSQPGKLWVRLDIHLAACLVKNPVPSSAS
jgi:hypothetical protein